MTAIELEAIKVGIAFNCMGLHCFFIPFSHNPLAFNLTHF